MRRKARGSVPGWLVEQWPDAVLLTDAKGRIAYVNRAFEALTGYARADVIGRTPAMLKSGSQSRGFYRRLWARLRAGKPFRAVFLNRRRAASIWAPADSGSPAIAEHMASTSGRIFGSTFRIPSSIGHRPAGSELASAL